MNLKSLQDYLIKCGIEAFFLPINDEFFSESVPEHNKRLNWVTSFSGSYASVIVTPKICHFFTDGRYLTQLKTELDPKHYVMYDVKQTKPWEIMKKPDLLSFDPKLVTGCYLKNFGCNINLLTENPVDSVWLQRPKPAKVEIYKHKEIYSGESSISKCTRVALKIPFFITSSDSVSWLANIRANEINYNPHVNAHAILYPDSKLQLFIQSHHFLSPKYDLEEHLEVLPMSLLPDILANINDLAFDSKMTSIYYQNIIEVKANAEYLLYSAASKEHGFTLHDINTKKNMKKHIHVDDVCELPKAYKNQCEIEGSISSHKKDGIAHIEFFYWLRNNIGATEIEASQELFSYRKKHDLFVENSFETISAFAENGAIIHYHPTHKTNKQIIGDNLYLLDSGGQYLNGTTDITRTIAIGTTTKEQKLCYTLVLKGLINLSTAIFPKGTLASQLDSLARLYLWKNYYDFPHGTGHGVGSFLSVHEGPQSFSSSVKLMPGMIISNEPGYYIEGKYGIRLENLMYVHDINNGFLSFKTLTLVPFDLKLIDFDLLNNEERSWIVKYHNDIFHTLKNDMSTQLQNFYADNFLFKEKS